MLNSLLIVLPAGLFLGWFVYSFFTARVQPDYVDLASPRSVETGSNLAYQFRNVGIVVNQKAKTITFYKCHMSNGFWTFWATPEFTCPLDDVLAVYHQNMIEGGVSETRIVTRHGKAQIHTRKKEKGEEDLRKIRDYLASLCADSAEVGVSSSPMFPMIVAWILAAIILAVIIYFT